MKERSKPAIHGLPRLSSAHSEFLLWHYHAVNHVNNAIRSLDVSLGDSHTIHLNSPVTVLNLEILPLKSPDRSRLLQVTCCVFTLNYMRVQDRLQLGRVFEQRINSACGKLGEGFIARGEDSVRPFAFERLRQSGGRDRLRPRFKRTRTRCNL